MALRAFYKIAATQVRKRRTKDLIGLLKADIGLWEAQMGLWEAHIIVSSAEIFKHTCHSPMHLGP